MKYSIRDIIWVMVIIALGAVIKWQSWQIEILRSAQLKTLDAHFETFEETEAKIEAIKARMKRFENAVAPGNN